jgi:amino acid adenylation domain-containing protein
VDGQVKVRGYRIELGEVEAVLSEHAAVQQAVVVVREDVPGEKRLVAYLVMESSNAVNIGDVRRFLREKLPEYMVPSTFVILPTMPLTRHGKVDRAALPAPEQVESRQELVAPRTPIEELLVNLYAEVLHVERVSREDNFFELGGHSLLATQLISRIREVFQLEVPLRLLFEQPTVTLLAEGIKMLRTAGDSAMTPPAIERVSREGPLPLSFAQQRLWFIDQLEAGSPFYNSPAAVRLYGQLDLPALEQTFTELVRRHESLRTHFAVEGGEPVQVIAEAEELSLPVTDLRQMGEQEREAEMERLAREEAQRAFDLSRGPMLRVAVLRLGEEEHVLLMTMHHIVSDAWSMGVLVREVAALYEAYSEGRPSPLAELPIQYADYAAWQREWLRGDVLEEQLSYWREQLGGELPVLELPTDHLRPSARSYRGGQLSFEVSGEVLRGVKQLSRRQGATLFMTLLGAFQLLLMRYSGQEEIIVGTDIASRTRTETEPLIGFFINELVMRTDLRGDPTFEELVERVREVCLGAYAHQDLPFERLVEELAPERSLSHTPLFQVQFLVQNTPTESLELPGLRLEAVHTDSGAARFDLTLAMREYEGQLMASAQYNADLFERETIERMGAHFQTLLAGIVADPQQRLSQLPLLSAAERHQLLVEWNDTQQSYPREQCIHQLFEEQVERTPDAVAVLSEGEEVSYSELNRRANQLAHHLRSLGVGPEVLVGVCLERSVEMVVAVLGVLKAGGAYLPLDPEYPLERLAWMLEDSNVPLLLAQEQVEERLPTHWGQTINLDAEWERITKQSAENPVRIVAAENLAYVIYTSGSTGTPKGIMVPHRGLTNYLSWCAPTYALSNGQGALMHTSLGFDLSVTSLYAPLLVGQKVGILNGHHDVDALARVFQRSRDFSFIKLTPAHLALLSAQLTRTEVEGVTSVLVVGGENLLAETSSFWQSNAPSTRIFNEYGPTETVVGCCVHELGESDKHKGSIPIGRPISNTQIYILDSRQQVVPVGVAGEIYIGGEGLARGYLKRPELTAERFIPHPFSTETGARLYRTGDVGKYKASGEIEFLGRVDGQVKVRGYRIELGEVEAVLSEHAAVEAAVVVVREDAPGKNQLVAYVVRRAAAASVEGSELRAALREKLPEYMIPSAFVMMEELPLTPNGKVDRAALPAPEQVARGGEVVAPRTPIEELLVTLYAEVLHVERVSREDNFFELGGHSLLATQLISRIREVFQLEVPLRALFDYPTVAELSAVLEGSIIKEVESLSDEEAQRLL